ncbi:50S ribosomal protein L29 [Candidatus Kaiserbacteria bacterium]|nr:50S ribosomal protein L29 [Candidatus Kaiserbacteria bacterium]
MADINTQDTQDLRKAVADNREVLRALRFGGAGSRSRDVRATRMLRRATARMLTELRARDLAQKGKKA